MTTATASPQHSPRSSSEKVEKMFEDGAECSVVNMNSRSFVLCQWPRLVAHHVRQRKGLNDIQCLPNELLAEILYRRGCRKSVVQCKIVCKRWCALMSQAEFIHELDRRYSRPSHHFLFRVEQNVRACKEAELYKKDLLFSLENRTFSFISDKEGNGNSKVVGSSHDLVLYCRNNKVGKCHEFYIRNIQTKQRIQLPASPFYYTSSLMFGFICDPPADNENNNSICKYSVVVIHGTHLLCTEFPAHFLLSTNANKWCEKILSVPEPCDLNSSLFTGFAVQGKHFFGSQQGPIFVDPYPEPANNMIECPLIPWPPHFTSGSQCIGVCDGNLLFSFITYNKSRVWVWMLKGSEWCLLHSVAKRDLVSIDPLLKKRDFKRACIIGCVLGFDPTNSDVVYTFCWKGILLWNLRKRTLQLISPMSKHRRDIEWGGFMAYPVSLPSQFIERPCTG